VQDGGTVAAPQSEQTGRAAVAALAFEALRIGDIRLRIGHHVPEGGGRGTVVLLPGRAEFIEKYAETLEELAVDGYAVAILDWRGQGGSDRLLDQRHRGHIVQVEDYLADLAALLVRLGELQLPSPFVMLAHSLGGHVGLRYLHDHPGAFAGAVMTAPMFGIRLQPTPAPLARAICAAAVALGAATRYAPGQRDFDPARLVFARNRLTSCPDHHAGLIRQLTATPELALGGVTYGWLGAALRSIALTRRRGYLETIRTPVLVCQAGSERIVSNAAQLAVVRRLPRGRLLRFADARHELLQERLEIRREVMAAFRAFAAEIMP
jgi:lysophospholipase